MNSHNPFNTGGSGGCTNDFRSADQLVDRIIGDAYHVVKEVYLSLGNLTYIYNYLQKYGLIITVDSEDAIKDIPLSIGKFARVYNKSDTAGYYFTDYLYVEDDRTGIIPNDSTATGSWVSTKATGSNASFVRIWKYRAVADGETIIQLPTDMPIVAVQTIYVQGIRQDVGEGFIYNEGNATLTLADELEAGNLVTVIIGISDPDMDIDVFEVLKNADGASNIGTSAGITVEEALSANNANAREHWRRQLAEAGLNLVDGSFEHGAEVSTANDAVWYIAGGQCYTWGGTLPHVVAPGANPLADSNWKPCTDQLLRQNLGSSEKGSGASLSMTEQGITVQDALRYLTISATGLAATDEAIKNAAIAKCELLGMDLVINPGSYKFITPLVWNAKRYSIRGTGNVTIDFTGLPAGSYAITVKPEATSAGTIWNAAAHSLSGLIFKGAPGIHGIKIAQDVNFDSPQITVRDCLFNEFDDHVTFGDNEWCCSFERVKFRANTNGSSRFVVIDKAYNGCENQRFLGCNFNGSNSGMGIKHIAGSCELTFDGCSFDYCHQVLSSVNAGARGIWRFNDVHFEDDGTTRQFDISSGNATFYVDLNQCDWAYITKDESGKNRIPTSIGAFESTNQKSTLRLSGCKFPIYDDVSDRSKSYLWVINNSAVRILANGNVIEHSTNQYFNMFSFGLNKFLALTDANRNSPALVTNGLGSITYDTSDLPANRIDDNTWCITGVISGNVMIPIDPSNREINLSGNLKRTSSEYYIDVRFFTALNVQLSAISLGVPGGTNTWVHFGQTIRAPTGAAFIRVGWAYAAAPSTTDTLRLNSFCVEQY